MTTERDYYEILGVAKGADPVSLKNAYRKLAKQYHPDCDGGSETKFKELNEAYAILSDPEKRAAYDRFGKAGVNGGGVFIDSGRFTLRNGAIAGNTVLTTSLSGGGGVMLLQPSAGFKQLGGQVASNTRPP